MNEMENEKSMMKAGQVLLDDELLDAVCGGQKQRLMIARAVAPKPKILMFDEATSALDNKTQKQVADALDALKCTRIVIAHRLSTIRRCDRILVLDQGKIIEDGSYDELIARNGLFAELVERQRLMIARAVAPKPKILMFDEATSALDNLTQKQVSQALDRIKCTRIVIAHRLSTIRQCDRIIVLDKGKIIEDGSYEELIENNGVFAELVARQRLDDTSYVGMTTIF